jgi:hypothetical protein
MGYGVFGLMILGHHETEPAIRSPFSLSVFSNCWILKVLREALMDITEPARGPSPGDQLRRRDRSLLFRQAHAVDLSEPCNVAAEFTEPKFWQKPCKGLPENAGPPAIPRFMWYMDERRRRHRYGPVHIVKISINNRPPFPGTKFGH